MVKALSDMSHEELIAHREDVRKSISRYKNLQMSKKVCL